MSAPAWLLTCATLIGIGIHPNGVWASTPLFRVVLDPGHGGTDLGTVYESGPTRIAEKDLTLILSQEVARELKQQGVQVELTRSQDIEIPLGKRTALANQLKADVFVSIHLNSQAGALGTVGNEFNPAAPLQTAHEGTASGIETYILNHTSDASSHRLARLENSVLGGREVGSEAEPGNLDVALILKDLTLDHNLSDSKNLACSIQERLIARTSKSLDRGVKQALFHVLLGADMPSVLVEAGFLSHARDRALLVHPTSRSKIAHSIAEGILRYQQSFRHPRKISQTASVPCRVH